jgi:ABC-type enterochelin transport system ATPase subunit
MKFDSRLWKLDLENLWWNVNRLNILNSLLSHFEKGSGPAHLTGGKGAGKSTLAAVLSKKIPAKVIRMDDDRRDIERDFTDPIIIIDEAQKISEEDRKQIMHINQNVLMVSVQDLSSDGYKLVHKIKDLDRDEIDSYIEHQGVRNLFADDAMDELLSASQGRPRLMNLLCKTALEDVELVDKMAIRRVATKKFKLKYKYK